MNTTIETNLDILPFFGFILIAAGIVKLYLYYKAFKIRVLSFLTIDEIIISFADNLLSYFTIFFLSTLFTVSFINGVEPNIYGLSLGERLVSYFQSNWVLLMFILLTNIGMLIFGLRPNIYRYETCLNIALSWLVFFLFPLLVVEIKVTGNLSDAGVRYLFLIASILSLISYSIGSAISETHKVKKRGYFNGSEFEMGKKLIISDDSFYYVGHSKRYIYFFDAKKRRSEVVPIEKVHTFKFTR